MGSAGGYRSACGEPLPDPAPKTAGRKCDSTRIVREIVLHGGEVRVFRLPRATSENGYRP